MKTQISLILSVFLFPFLLFSQDTSTVSWTPYTKKKRDDHRIKMVASLDESFITLRRFRKISDRKGDYYTDQFELTKSKLDGSIVLKKVLKLTGLPQDPENLNFLFLHDKLSLIYEYFDKGAQQYMLEKKNIDLETLTFEDQSSLLTTIPSKEDLYKRNYRIIHSTNKDFILIFKENWNEGETKILSIDYHVFTHNFEPKYSRNFQSAFLSKRHGFATGVFSNAGDLYIGVPIDRKFGYLPDIKHPKKKEVQFEVHSLHADTTRDKVYNIKSSDYYLNSLSLNIDSLGHLHGSGFYSERNRISAHGIMSFQIDLQQEVLGELVYSKFPETFSKEFLNTRRFKNEKGYINWIFQGFFQKPGGERYLLGQNLELERKLDGSQKVSLGNIFVFKLDVMGNIVWYNSIAKHQKIKEEYFYNPYEYISILGFQDDQYIRFIFNDYQVNFHAREQGLTNANQGKIEILTQVSLDEAGNLSQKILKNLDEEKAHLVHSGSYYKDQYSVFLYVENRKAYQWGKVNLLNP